MTMDLAEKARFHVPSVKGYGRTGFDAFRIGPNTDLVFEIEILSIAGSVDSSAGAPITSAPTPAARTTSTSSNSAAATKGKAATTSQPPGKDNASGESAWRKLNKTFRSHMDKDVKSQATAAADWSTAMSEYLIFAHKLRGDKGPAPTRVSSSKKSQFAGLNTAFHKWLTAQKDSTLDADWSPPIRDYIKHAAKLASS